LAYWLEGAGSGGGARLGWLEDAPDDSGAMIGPEGVSAVGSEGDGAGLELEAGCVGKGLISPWLREGDW
jgi:hypothetical protein